MAQKITKYGAKIDLRTENCELLLRLESGEDAKISVHSVRELASMMDILRNELSCWYDVKSDRLIVGPESVGENDSDY